MVHTDIHIKNILLINFLLERFHKELNIKKKNNKCQNNNNYTYNRNFQMNEQLMLKMFIKEFEISYNSIIYMGTLSK